MTRSKVEQQLEIVETLVRQHPSGIGRAALETAFRQTQGREIAMRTLHRRLERLIQKQRISVEGVGPATGYKPVEGAVSTPSIHEPDYVPLSVEGSRVRALVRRTQVEKVPIGYDAALLARYHPGRTWYLPLAARERLHEMGRTPDGGRPAGTFAREIFGRLLIDLAWASSRLEGNTYSRLDTQNLIEFGQRAEGKDVDTSLALHQPAVGEFSIIGG